jgi:hypothetical protein
MSAILISTNAFLADMICNHYEELPNSILSHISKVVDYSLIPERVMVDNESVRSIIKWERVEKMQLIRVFIRCLDQKIDMLDKILPCINRFDYNIKELAHLLQRRPQYIEYFPIDLCDITTSEAAFLLSLGDDYFFDKINFSKYTFNFKESMSIIQGYKYKREVIEKVNYKSLKGYQVAEILINTGERNIDLLNMSLLTNIDWINLLEKRPELLKYCDYDKFLIGDIFYLIKLCCMFESPDLSYLIINRGLDNVSPFGWEKLLIEKPDIFLDYCDFNKLDENNWKHILREHPEFVVYKIGELPLT